MSIIDVLFNAASGGVFGSILHLATSAMDTWKKKQEVKMQIELMEAQAASAEKAAAWTAFANSQQSSAPFNVPSNVSPMVANIYTVVEAFKNATRPGLTWTLVAVLVAVYFASTEIVRAEMTPEITFGSFTALFWWFGSRYTKRG